MIHILVFLSLFPKLSLCYGYYHPTPIVMKQIFRNKSVIEFIILDLVCRAKCTYTKQACCEGTLDCQ